MATVDDFKAKLTGGGARANLFKVTVNFPGFANGDTQLASFMVKGAQLPGTTLGQIEVPFRGRMVKLAGDRTFEPINLNVLNDVGMEIRNAFERWANGISNSRSAVGLTNPTSYQSDVIIEQLTKNGGVSKRYKLVGAFPVSIDPVELSFDTTDAVEEFTVQLAYQYFESSGVNSGNVGAEILSQTV
jgi:hypothetical protein